MSPFLPDTQIQYALDSTSLGWFKTCPRLYQYSMIEGWVSRKTGLHLKFGQHYATALEHFHKHRAEGLSFDEAQLEVVREAMIDTYGWDSEDTAKNRETLIRTIIWYLEDFREDPAETLILSNGRPAVEMSFRFELDWGPIPGQPYILCGHLDRIVNFQGMTLVTDNKTTGQTLSATYYSGFDLDNQMSLYSVAAQVVFDTPVKGVLIDAAQIAVGFSRFGRAPTYRTPEQQEEWLFELRHWLDLMKRYAEAGFWPRNDKACFTCIFKKVCSSDPRVRHIHLNSDFEKRHWNPLEPR